MCEVLQASSGARLFRLVTLFLLVTAASVAVKADNRHSEQIIFSGVGFGHIGGVDTPFGFWLWCQNGSSGNGLYGRDLACAGAVYIYELGLTKGVLGFGSNGGVTEDPDGFYHMHVHSADNAIDAIFSNDNEDVTPGPTNAVTAVFTAPPGGGTSTNAVVQVTGQGED